MDTVEIRKVENIWTCNGRGVIRRMRDIENATGNLMCCPLCGKPVQYADDGCVVYHFDCLKKEMNK